MMKLSDRLAQNNNRADGYTQAQANAVCMFQGDVESGIYGTPDYDRLRECLAESRKRHMTYIELVDKYKGY